jgi:alpha-1,2-mannosyltransferase
VLAAQVWRGAGSTLVKGALLVALATLASPYVHPYDLVLLAVPIAVLIGEGRRSGFLPWEHAVLIAAFLLPAFVIAASVRGVPLLPLVAAALVLVTLRRLRSETAPQ